MEAAPSTGAAPGRLSRWTGATVAVGITATVPAYAPAPPRCAPPRRRQLGQRAGYDRAIPSPARLRTLGRRIPAGDLRSSVAAESEDDIRDVPSGGARRDVQGLGDLAIGQAGRDQHGDVLFARRQLSQRRRAFTEFCERQRSLTGIR